MRNKLAAVFMIVLILSMMILTAYAQTFDADRVGSISVTLVEQDGKKPIAGVELSVYYVATVNLNSNNKLSYTFAGAFEDCSFALDDAALSAKLDAFVNDHSVSAEKRMTDAQGSASFANLPLGLYFVKQTNEVLGYAPCTSFLVTVPSDGADGYAYDVNASPKTDIIRLVDVTVRKEWNTDASTKVEDSVTVQLLKAGNVVKTAKLNAQNDWKVTYTDMPESDAYSIVEVNVPEGFTATYSQRGYVFTVTNSASLAQTGQLTWPIPILAMSGLCFITVGAIVLRKTRNKNA